MTPEVTFEPLKPNNTGWHAPELAPWLEQSITRAGEAAFGKPMAYMGEGGTIPFMAMLGAKFPEDAVRDHRRSGAALQCPRAE